MSYMTTAEKEQLELWVHRYVNAGHDIPAFRYKRLMSWLGGMSYADIAAEEAVSPSAIRDTTSLDIKRIREFIREEEKI